MLTGNIQTQIIYLCLKRHSIQSSLQWINQLIKYLIKQRSKLIMKSPVGAGSRYLQQDVTHSCHLEPLARRGVILMCCTSHDRIAHCHVYKSLPSDPIHSQLSPIHSFTTCFSKINFNIILPSTPRSSEWSLALEVSQPKVCMEILTGRDRSEDDDDDHSTHFLTADWKAEFAFL
jgi:hypothetical protein